MMQRWTIAAASCALLTLCAAQDKPALGKMVTEVRQSLAQNQAKLRAYTWTETTEVSLKGEVKKREQAECRYDASGKVVKTPIGAPAEPKKARGLKGKMVANKVEEMKEYMDRVGSLVRRYVPLDPQAMKAAHDSGKVMMGVGDSSSVTLEFRDYAKPGDKVTIVLNEKTKQIRSFAVNTYLDSQEDAVRLNASFTVLEGGVSCVEQTVLQAAAKEIEIKTTNFGHHK